MRVPLLAVFLILVITAHTRHQTSIECTTSTQIVNCRHDEEWSLNQRHVDVQMYLNDASSVVNPTADRIIRAERAIEGLQRWYNISTGIWESTGWWNAANIMTMLGDLAKSDTENKSLQRRVKKIYLVAQDRAPAKNPKPLVGLIGNGTIALYYNGRDFESGYDKYVDPDTYEPHTTLPTNWFVAEANLSFKEGMDPEDWLNGFYDDNLWWALAWISVYDVFRSSPTPYLDLVEGIFRAMTKVWPTHCGNGGIYWSWKKDYVNAISNELFFSTAAHLANRAHNKTHYLNWAQKSLGWFQRTGMINSNGTINDGLTNDCSNNNGTTWSYNQGVILGGLVELYRASPKPTYLLLATRIALAAIEQLSDENGIIHDACEPNCGADGSQFKGIFMRNLQKLHQAAPDATFRRAIERNAESIWRNDREDGVFSINWAGKFVSPANASTHSSAMDALIAAITVS